MHGQTPSTLKLLSRAYRAVLKRMWTKEAVFTVTLGAAAVGVIDRQDRDTEAPHHAKTAAGRQGVIDAPTVARPESPRANVWSSGMSSGSDTSGDHTFIASRQGMGAGSPGVTATFAPAPTTPVQTGGVSTSSLQSWRPDAHTGSLSGPAPSAINAYTRTKKDSESPSGMTVRTVNILAGSGSGSGAYARPVSHQKRPETDPMPGPSAANLTVFTPTGVTGAGTGSGTPVATTDATPRASGVGDMAAPAANPSFVGGVVGIPVAAPGGVFAPEYSSRVDKRMTTARTLIIYCHGLGTPDMYSASANGQLGATTRYDYMNKMANEQRQWYAVNSGGKMDASYTFIDSGEIGYKDGTTPWGSPFDLITPLLAANNLNRSDYDYVQLVWADMMSSPYALHPSGTDGVANGSSMWANNTAEHHEMGHNLGFSHANNLDNTSRTQSQGGSLYTYDFVTKQYVSTSSTNNSTGVQVRPLTVGLIRNDYGSPVDVMSSGSRDKQYGPRDKQKAGWLTSKQFGTITPGADGDVSNIAIHNPAGLVVVTDGNVLPGQEGLTGRYGVEKGYADAPYAATFVRKAQKFVPNATNTGGKWVTYTQVIDLNYREVNASTVGVELRVDGAYYGMIQKGQKLSEKDFAQFIYVQSASPWDPNKVFYDLLNDLHAAAPDNPNRYRSTWYDLEYTDTGADGVGDYANLRVTTHVGSTPIGHRWSGGNGTWNTTSSNWLNLDNGNEATTWSDTKDATFGTAAGAAGTVTLAGAVSAASLTFKPTASGVYTLTGSTITLGAGGLNAEASADIESNLNFSDQQVWEILAGKTVELSGTITDNGNTLQKIGLGTLALNASQTLKDFDIYEGAVTQSASQTFTTINIFGYGEYAVKGGTLMLQDEGKITGEKGFPSTLRLSRTDSTTASPELQFLGSGEVSSEVLLDAGQHVIQTNVYVPKISGNIRGAGGITLDAADSDYANRLELTGANTFTGDIEIRRGSLHVIGIDSLQGNNTLRFDVAAGDSGRFFLRGTDRSVKDLSSSGAGAAFIANAPGVRNDGTSAAATLTVTQNNSGVFGGTITDTAKDSYWENGTAGALSLVKKGNATLTLTGSNSYTGGTTIAAGTLRVKSADNVGTGKVRLTGGTLSIDQSQGLTRTAFAGTALDKSAVSGGTYTGDFSPLHSTSGNVLPTNTTYAYTGKVFLTAGDWSFGENFDTSAYLKVNGVQIFDNGSWWQRSTGSINIASDGWYDIDLRVFSNRASGWGVGPTYDSSGWLADGIGIGIKKGLNTGTNAGGVSNADGSLYTKFETGALGIRLKDTLVFANDIAVDADSGLEILDTESIGDVRLTGALSGSGALTKTGAGLVTFAGLNTHTGATRISGGTVAAGAVNALGSASAFTLDNTAGVTLSLNGFDQTIASLAGGGATGGNIALGGATLTVGGDNTNTAFAGRITGNGGLRKVGNGALRLDFANAAVSSDILSSTAAVTLGGGTLEWRGKSGATNTQTLNGVTLLANTRSTLKLTQNGATSLDLRLGNIVTASGATLDFQGGTTDGAGTPTQGARFSFTTVNGNTVANGARLGDFATWNGTDWAANSGISDGAGGSYIRAYNGYVNIYNGTTPGPTLIATNAAADVKINEATGGYGNNTLGAGSTTINSLLMSAGGHAASVDMNGKTLVVGAGANASGGIAVGAGAKGLTLGTIANQGQLTAGVSGASTLGLISNNNAAADGLVVNARIVDSKTVSGGAGTTGLLVSGGTGGGTVVLAGDNTFTGDIRVVSGAKLQVGAGGATGNLGGAGGVFGAVSLDAGTRLAFNRSDAALVVANAVSGAGDLVQSGSGTTTLTGANTYTGATVISAGTLQIGNNGATGSLGSGSVSGTGTLAFNRTGSFAVANSIGGGVSVSKLGAGTTILTGDNTYSGGTVINGGILQLGDGGTAGTLGSGAVSGTGTLAFNRAGTFAVANDIGGGVSVSKLGGGTVVFTGTNGYTGTTTISTGTLQVGAGGASGTLGSGAVTNNGVLAFNRSDALLSVSAAIGGTGSVRQDGAGTTILTGTNTYDGGTLVNNGTLQVGNNGATGTLGDGEVTVNGTLAFNRNNTVTMANTVNGLGMIVQNGSGTLVLSGDGTRFSGDLIANSGVLQIGDGGANGNFFGSRMVTNATIAFKRSDTIDARWVISGTGGVTQAGTGTLILSGNNTYEGLTTINANSTLQIGSGGTSGNLGAGAVMNDGTLIFNRSNTISLASAIGGAGAVIQNGTGTTSLSGANTYAGTTTINAGTLRLTSATIGQGALNINTGGTFSISGGSDYTTIALANDVNLNGGSVAIQRYFNNLNLNGAVFVGPGGATLSTHSTDGGTTTGNITVNGLMSGSGAITLINQNSLYGAGKGWFNNAANTYSGTITSGGSFLGIGANTALQYATINLTPASTNTNQVAFASGVTAATIGGLSGNALGGMKLQTGSTAVALTVNQAATTTFDGVLSGTGSLTKSGAGALTLTHANTYTGGTTVSGGVLALDFSATGAATSNILASSGAMTLNGGTLRIIGKAGANGVVQTFAGLTSGTGSSTFELVQNGATTLDVNVGALTFGSGTLNFLGLTGTTAGARVITSTNAGANDATTQLSATSALWNGTDWASVQQVGGTGPNYLVKWTGTYNDLFTNSNAPNATGNLRINNSAEGTAANYTADTTIGSLLMIATNNATTIGIDAGKILTVGASTTGNVAIAATGKSLTLGQTAGQGTLTAGTSGAASLNLSNGNAASLLTVNADIADNGSPGGVVSLTTAGKVTLNGDLSYTGATTVTAGSTLTVKNLLNGGAYASSILNNGTLNLNGVGVQTLSGTLTGTGLTTVRNGTLKLGGVSLLGMGQQVAMTTGTTLDLAGQVAGLAQVSISGTGVGGAGALINGSMTRGEIKNLSLAGNATVSAATDQSILLGSTSASDGTLNLAGYTLTKEGSGNLVLNGLTASADGDIVMNGGTLVVMDYFATPRADRTVRISGAGAITLNAGTSINFSGFNGGVTLSKDIVLNGGSIKNSYFYAKNRTIDSDITVAASGGTIDMRGSGFSGTLSGSGALAVKSDTDSALTFTGDSSYSGNLTVTGGTLALGGSGRIGSGNYAGAINLSAASSTFKHDSTAAQKLSGAITGQGKLTKSNSGTLTLSGNNGFSGGTTITAGTLVTAGAAGKALGNGNVSVTTGGTLQIGDGVNNGVTLGSGATLAMEAGSTLKLGATDSNIMMAGDGTFSLTSGMKLDITDLGMGSGLSQGQSTQYTLVTGSASGGTVGAWIASSHLIGGNLANYSYALALSGNNAVFTVTAVPEPATYGLLGAGALAAVALVRRRRRSGLPPASKPTPKA